MFIYFLNFTTTLPLKGREKIVVNFVYVSKRAVYAGDEKQKAARLGSLLWKCVYFRLFHSSAAVYCQAEQSATEEKERAWLGDRSSDFADVAYFADIFNSQTGEVDDSPGQ